MRPPRCQRADSASGQDFSKEGPHLGRSGKDNKPLQLEGRHSKCGSIRSVRQPGSLASRYRPRLAPAPSGTAGHKPRWARRKSLQMRLRAGAPRGADFVSRASTRPCAVRLALCHSAHNATSDQFCPWRPQRPSTADPQVRTLLNTNTRSAACATRPGCHPTQHRGSGVVRMLSRLARSTCRPAGRNLGARRRGAKRPPEGCAYRAL